MNGPAAAHEEPPAPRLGVQIGAQGSGRLIALALNMATFAVILSALDPTEYGRAALALTLAYILGTAAAFGIDPTVFRGISVGEVDGRVLAAAFVLRLTLTTLVGGAAVLVVLALPDSPMRTPLLVAFAAMPVGALVTLQQVLRARVRLVPFAIADVVGSALALAIVITLSARGLRPVDVVLSTVVPNLVVYLALAVPACRALRPRLVVRTLGADARGILRRSRMLAVGDATVVTYYRADVVALGATTGGAALGVYAAVYRFVDIAMYAQTIVIGAFFPRLARAWSDPAALRALLVRVGGLLLGLATIAFVTVVTLGPAVIDLFGDGAYGDTTVLVAILMTVTAVMFVNRLLIQTLIAGGHGGRQAVCWVGGLTGAALAFPLSALFAERGAGVAMLIGELLILGIAGTQLKLLGALPRPRPPGPVTVAFAAAAAVALAIAFLPDAARIPGGALLALATFGVLLLSVRSRSAIGGVDDGVG